MDSKASNMGSNVHRRQFHLHKSTNTGNILFLKLHPRLIFQKYIDTSERDG
jgi:hypothetical protein